MPILQGLSSVRALTPFDAMRFVDNVNERLFKRILRDV